MCGRCVSDHVEILTNLSVSIQRVRIPPYTILIITNETDLERINNLIMEKQVSYTVIIFVLYSFDAIG